MPIPTHLIESNYDKNFPAAVDEFPTVINEEHYIDAWLLNSVFNSLIETEEYLLTYKDNIESPLGDDIIGDDGNPEINIPPALYKAYKTALAWDSNLLAENIADGVTIFGVLGTFLGEGAGEAAYGGLQTLDGLYRVHTFINSGTFSVLKARTAEVLVIAGGGSGAVRVGGGGGGGGYVYNAAKSLVIGEYEITIGAGGAAATGSGSTGVAGNDGEDSIYDDMTAEGGGGGGAYATPKDGRPGGCGGGGAGYSNGAGGAGSQGEDGGAGVNGGGGGGGGCTEAGASGNGTDSGGKGGDGYTSTIRDGSSQVYGGGGGGGGNVTAGAGGTGGGGAGTKGTDNPAVPGDANSGGGGGGNRNASDGSNFVSGAGGSGIVIIRYLKD